ncbi:MAG: efflux RND transporter permease subunit [Paracoccaceae bacterium]
MTLSDISVRRPVLAAVANLLLIVFGITALRDIPIRELPDVDNAVVTVTTTYRGAAPEVIDTDITETVEGAVAAVSGIRSISSESRQGRSRVTIEFEAGRDVDVAANDVRDAVGRVADDLPDEADVPQVEKSDADADPVMRLAVVSDRMTTAEITDYIDRFIADRIATLDGVASLNIYGERPFAVRIWIDRRALAARKLTVADVERALARNNVELPAGEVTSADRQLTVRLNSRLQSVEDFADVVLDRVGGYPVRLRDVARVEPGVADDSTVARSDGRDAVGMAVQRRSQSNTLQISNAVRAEIERLRPSLPEGMDIQIGSDDALFVGASIREVVDALMISLVLVVMVILLFLRSFRATLIPAITIPVSLVGAFVLIGAWGFSLNTLTLLALLLAIGLVVDDAIVVLENIQRRIENGESPLVASLKGARQVTFAVLATSVTLIAVFIPLSFMPGQVGRLFIEFGWVMAGTVAISTFVALTACPALASKVLKPAKKGTVDNPEGPSGPVQKAYAALLRKSLEMPLVVIVLAGVVTAGAALFYDTLPRELAPREDRGVGFIPLTAPQGSTVEYTDRAAQQVEKLIQPLRDEGVVETVFTFTGWGNRAWRSFVVFRLAPWEERDMTAAEVAASLAPKMGQVTLARGFPITPAGLGLRGNSTPVQVVVSGPDFDSVKGWANELLQAAEGVEGLVNPEINFEQNLPQLEVRIDRQRADDLRVSVETIASTMQSMLASRQVTGFISRGREYPVILQAEEADRRSPSDIDNIYIRAESGSLVPLGALVRIEENAAAPSLRRFDRLPSIQLSGALAPGADLGAVLGQLEEAAAGIIPAGGKLGYEGQSRTFKDTAAGATAVFAMALLIVFLVLAAQFESFVHPVIILLTVPAGVAGAIYAMAAGGLSLNVYSQIGIILLIGLVAKNGILIVEFANQLRDEGKSVREAVILAAVLRLRPIVMTVLSTILGALPLLLATGAGAESRSAIGTVIIAGLAMSSVLMLVVTPVLYDLLARFTRPRGHVEMALERELDAAG